MKIFKHLPVYGITILALSFLMLIQLSAQDKTPAPQRPVFRMPPRIISPEILPDNKVTFRLYSRDAVKVSVSGEWMSGFGASEIMAKNDTGLFTLTVGPLNPELYAYNFIVDGVNAIDPNNVYVRRDGSRYQSFFIVAGPGSDLYAQKDGVPHGTVTKTWYRSSVLEMDRRVYVYTPAGYEAGKQKYPVFFLLHGAGGDEDAWTNMGRAAQILDNLIAQGKAKPMIVVMTNGNANQSGAQNEIPLVQTQEQGMALYQKLAGKFELHLVKDLIPFIEKNYRTLKGKDNRAIAGLSMGGMHTQTITNDNPGLFGYIGVFSMGLMTFPAQNQDQAKLDQERDAKIDALRNSGYKLYWIGCGKDDFLFQSVIKLRETLDKHNFKYTYRESTGGHTWTNWRIYLSEFAPLLFK
ncbi:MAG TPA: alpha/beta hydrolase-fold protein [Bacteroidales bacterium]|nr:alpha/beta hydrolase-fold protein [Bacteroidales bacterium]